LIKRCKYCGAIIQWTLKELKNEREKFISPVSEHSKELGLCASCYSLIGRHYFSRHWKG